MKSRATHVADLLMGAAYAKGSLKGVEKATVRQILRGIMQVSTLPMDMEMRLDDFNPKNLDLAATGASFVDDPLPVKRQLLDFISSVHAADEEFDLAEDDYLRKVGEAIGIPEA